jgi:transposase
MFKKKTAEPQQTIWVPTTEIVSTPANSFYERLNTALDSFGFGDQVRALCEPFYCTDESVGGYPGIDPEVYFKMLLIGFFENLPSERGIAARCADSLSIREFLHYTLTESTPTHSSFTVIRKRLDADVYRQVFALVLAALKKHKLLKGKRLGIDASVLEANASLRSLEHRLTGEAYWQYVKRLAAAAGVNTEDAAAVRRFDKNREGRTTSNDDWKNPHDPDAKVGRTKRGATRMVYKPEHIVDLDTGAIVDVDVRPGDEGDTEDLAERVLDAEERLNEAIGNPSDTATIEVLTNDKGYYKVSELRKLQELGIKTVTPDSIDNRRIDKLSSEDRKAVESAKRSVSAKYGKELLKRRGMYVERSFEHVLDCGGARRTTLRGRENITKRYLVQAMGANISLLMRKLTGIGTPKQAIAATKRSISLNQSAFDLVFTLQRLLSTLRSDYRATTASLANPSHLGFHDAFSLNLWW